MSVTPVADASGAIVRIFVAARAVDEDPGVRPPTAVERSGLDAERCPNIRFMATPAGRIQRVSAYLFAHAGLPPDTPAWRSLECVHPEDRARLTPGPPGRQTGAGFETDVRLRRHDGRYRWFRVRADYVEGLAGLGWYGVAMDIQAAKTRLVAALPTDGVASNALGGFGDCSVTIDEAWRITSITPDAARWVGLTERELLGVDCRERLAVPSALVAAVESSLAARIPLQVEIPAPAQPSRWVEFQAHPFQGGVSILFWDVTERRLTHQSVRSATKLLQSLLDAASGEMALLDEDGVIVSVNAAWRKAFDSLDRDAAMPVVGGSYVGVCAAAIPEIDEPALHRGLSEVIAGHTQSYVQPFVVSAPAGLAWRQLRIIPFRLDPAPHFVAIHEDITDVTRARAALRNTAEALLTAQEEERQRIAIELHDSTSQHLAALGMGIARLQRLIDSSGAAALLTDMSKSVQETIKEIRVLSYLMKPPGLGREGLETTARRFVSGFGARTGLNARFRADGPVDDCSAPVQHTAFRVVQEALSNVYRHAGAASVDVDLKVLGGALILRIADDGKGISLLRNGAMGAGEIGVGIASMQFRVAQLAGTLNISGETGGAVVEATIPMAAGDA